MMSHGIQEELSDVLLHLLKLLVGIMHQERMLRYLLHHTAQRSCHTLAVTVEIDLGLSREREQQTGRHVVHDLPESDEHLLRSKGKHGGKKTTGKETRTLLQQTERLFGIVLQSETVHLALPHTVVLAIEAVEHQGQLSKARLLGILIETQGTYEPYPHLSLGMHSLQLLVYGHCQPIEPAGHTSAPWSRIFQFQFCLPGIHTVGNVVGRMPFVTLVLGSYI